MVHTFYLNSLELTPTYDIYIAEDPSLDSSTSYESSPIWRGTSSFITDIDSKETKFSFKGACLTEAGIRSILYYDSHNYDWNLDEDDVYLVRDLSRRWKVSSIEVKYTLERDRYSFTMTVVAEKYSPEGYVLTSKTGSSASSPISVSSVVNAGDKNTLFDIIKITGSYSSGANLVSPLITQYLVGYDLEIADVLLDTAYFEFYNDYTAKHTYIDAFNSADKFSRNKSSSTAVTFSTDHLAFAASAELKYRFRLTHPLLQDPILTLTLSSITGSPKLEVSPDNTTWWEVEKNLANGSLVDYNLTKLAGYSDFYFRITTTTGEALNLSYMKLISWHDYSGQRPIPYLRKSSESETYNITFSSGTLDYDMRYRDGWTG